MRASYGFIERNFNLVRRYWGWEVVWLAYSIASALSITFIGAGMEQISGASVEVSRNRNAASLFSRPRPVVKMTAR